MSKTLAQNTAYEAVQKAVMCLRLEVDESIANDVQTKINNALAEAKRDVWEQVEKAFPTSWLDNLLTGPDAVIGKPPYGCPDIEALLSAVKDRIAAALRSQTK